MEDFQKNFWILKRIFLKKYFEMINYIILDKFRFTQKVK